MYVNSAYLNNSRIDFKDYSAPLVVGSCGTYRLLTREKLPTFWQKGRRDYQILYVAAGKAHFWFDGKEEVVKAGNMVLYKPGEIQKYVYYLADKPEVFWVHFTGNDVKKILEYHGIHLDEHVFYTGTLTEYKTLFRKIIRELQLCRYGYEDYTASLLRNIAAGKPSAAEARAAHRAISTHKSRMLQSISVRIIMKRSALKITQHHFI